MSRKGKNPPPKKAPAWKGPDTLRPLLTPVDGLKPDPKNARAHDPRNIAAIQKSLDLFGQQKPIIVGLRGLVVAGNGTLAAAKALGWSHIATSTFDGDEREARAYAIADNRTAELAQWEPENLRETLQALEAEGYDLEADLGFTEAEVASLTDDGEEARGGAAATLADRFGVPPFTILDSRQGYWATRKKAWLALGLRSGEGRKADLTFSKSLAKYGSVSETSIFDPVLAEVAYRWFAPKAGLILDPFAGGSVRGVVAGALGMHYFGVDLRPEQVSANEAQWKALQKYFPGAQEPEWRVGDSAKDLPKRTEADLVFTCPPYFDLEQYSKDPKDLSNLTWDQFRDAYTRIVEAAAKRLRDNRFSVWVVGDLRDKDGFYRGLPELTIEAHRKAGMPLYNEAVYITPMCTLPVRAGRYFEAGRKLGKAHQNVLVFAKGEPDDKELRGLYDAMTPEARLAEMHRKVLVFSKGDPKKATEDMGPPEFGDIEEAEPDAEA